MLFSKAREFGADFAYLFTGESWKCWKIKSKKGVDEITLGVHKSKSIDYDGVDENMLDEMINDLIYIRSQVDAIRLSSGRYISIVDSNLHNICSASKNLEAHIRILRKETKTREIEEKSNKMVNFAKTGT